ncbi:MAG: manganese efflux pump [Lachnospiraceae bacterium]|nr:manganese efflux pump [Lachnospiraceae bacterium]
MTIAYAILIAAAMSMAVFAVTVQRGASVAKLDKNLLLSGLVSGALQLGATLAGYGIGKLILMKEHERGDSHFWPNVLAGILLLVVGIRMLLLAFRKQTILEHRIEKIDMKSDTLCFLRLCINAFVGAIACSLLGVSLLAMILSVFAASLVVVIAGYEVSRSFGDLSSSKAYAIGGSVLCAMGVILQVVG